jgi:hypothetical protein
MVCDIQSLLGFSRGGCSMHYEEEKLEIQSNGQKSGQMGEGGSKGGEGGGGGGTRMFVLDVKSKLDRMSCGYNFLY